MIKPDDTAENRPIEAGPSVGDMTVVTSGLKAGERVVVSGQYRLRPGTKVRHQLRNGGGRRRSGAMNISAPFIRRPVATSLLMIAIALLGVVAWPLLPVAPLPQVDFPTISVSASLPGASPETMASAVAQPLERQFGQIAGVTQMTSTSTLGVDLDHAAIRAEPQHRCRGAGRAGGDHRGGAAIADGPALAADLPQGQSRQIRRSW